MSHRLVKSFIHRSGADCKQTSYCSWVEVEVEVEPPPLSLALLIDSFVSVNAEWDRINTITWNYHSRWLCAISLSFSCIAYVLHIFRVRSIWNYVIPFLHFPLENTDENYFNNYYSTFINCHELHLFLFPRWGCKELNAAALSIHQLRKVDGVT